MIKAKKIAISMFFALFAICMCIGLSVMRAGADEVAESLSITGVSLRLKSSDEDCYGLKFDAETNAYDSASKYGIEIVPEDLKEDVSRIKTIYQTPKEYGEIYVFNASVLDILPANMSRPFTARAFKETDGAKTYSQWSEGKSIFTIATQALADKEAEFDKETENFLSGVVKTVLGETGGLTGKYVCNEVSYENLSGGESDLSDIACGDTVKVVLTLKKEGENNKILKAYPTAVLATDADGADINGAIEYVADTQDTFRITEAATSFKLKFTLADSEIYSGEMLSTVDKDGFGRINLAPGQVDHPIYPTEEGTALGSGATDLNYFVNNFRVLGDYGVGYKFVTKFKGKNMPQFILFANNENGCIGWGGSNEANLGYVILNGITHRDSWSASAKPELSLATQLHVIGPNRINLNLKTDVAQWGKSISLTNVKRGSQQPVYANLNDDVNYRYEIATSVWNGEVYFNIDLYNDVSGELVFCGEYNTGKTKAEIEAIGKKAIVYSALMGVGVNTRFSYAAPVALSAKEADNIIITENADGSKTYYLRHGDDNYGWTDTNGAVVNGGLDIYKNSYVELGEYGVGTKFVTKFKGNNMPQFLLFADGNLGLLKGTNGTSDCGMYITNGQAWREYTSDSAITVAMDFLFVHWQYRWWYSVKENNGGKSNLTNVTGTQPGVSNLRDDITYRYELESKEVGGLVYMYIKLFNDATGEPLFGGEFNTKKSKAEIEAIGKKVAIHAGIKGTDVDTEFTLYPIETV